MTPLLEPVESEDLGLATSAFMSATWPRQHRRRISPAWRAERAGWGLLGGFVVGVGSGGSHQSEGVEEPKIRDSSDSLTHSEIGKGLTILDPRPTVQKSFGFTGLDMS